jgi:hypothetical protein
MHFRQVNFVLKDVIRKHKFEATGGAIGWTGIAMEVGTVMPAMDCAKYLNQGYGESAQLVSAGPTNGEKHTGRR